VEAWHRAEVTAVAMPVIMLGLIARAEARAGWSCTIALNVSAWSMRQIILGMPARVDVAFCRSRHTAALRDLGC